MDSLVNSALLQQLIRPPLLSSRANTHDILQQDMLEEQCIDPVSGRCTETEIILNNPLLSVENSRTHCSDMEIPAKVLEDVFMLENELEQICGEAVLSARLFPVPQDTSLVEYQRQFTEEMERLFPEPKNQEMPAVRASRLLEELTRSTDAPRYLNVFIKGCPREETKRSISSPDTLRIVDVLDGTENSFKARYVDRKIIQTKPTSSVYVTKTATNERIPYRKVVEMIYPLSTKNMTECSSEQRSSQAMHKYDPCANNDERSQTRTIVIKAPKRTIASKKDDFVFPTGHNQESIDEPNLASDLQSELNVIDSTPIAIPIVIPSVQSTSCRQPRKQKLQHLPKCEVLFKETKNIVSPTLSCKNVFNSSEYSLESPTKVHIPQTVIETPMISSQLRRKSISSPYPSSFKETPHPSVRNHWVATTYRVHAKQKSKRSSVQLVESIEILDSSDEDIVAFSDEKRNVENDTSEKESRGLGEQTRCRRLSIEILNPSFHIDNQLICVVCEKSFRTKEQLELHRKIHKPPNVCAVCKKNVHEILPKHKCTEMKVKPDRVKKSRSKHH